MRETKQITIGNVKIGGGAQVSVQSMTNTDTRNVTATIEQIGRLVEVGCEIVRVAVPDSEAAIALGKITANAKIPIIADIHFNHKLALMAMDKGVAGLRINPGNIGSSNRVREVVRSARDKGVPIRIGVNAGSLEKELLQKYGQPTAIGMVESALGHIRILEDLNFADIKVSLKASGVRMTVEAYRLLAEKVDYPFHVGVSEAGTSYSGTIKSAIGIGALLLDGIGDTIRVSLTADPVEEVLAGYEILKSIGLREHGPEMISCPTCGRCDIDLIKIAGEVEKRLIEIDKPIKVAVMGCEVNGPGEAREADIGLAGGGNGYGLIFRKGQVIRKVKEKEMLSALMEEAKNL